MPGITNPAEEYFKDGLWGWVTNAWKKLVATAGGALHIQFAGQEVDVEVTQTAAADLTPGICGWDGDSWQKLPMLWGYSAIWDENLGGASPATTYTKSTSAIPADEIWILELVSIRNFARDTTSVSFYIARASGGVVFLAYKATLTKEEPLVITGKFTLRQGDVITISMSSVVINDVIQAGLTGYKMKIAE